MMMITFITFNSSLVPLIESLCISKIHGNLMMIFGIKPENLYFVSRPGLEVNLHCLC